jgi:hypothetical protein
MLNSSLSLITLTFFLFLPLVLQAQNLYTLQDLEMLKDEKQAHEFFQHAHDIRPSERQGPWKQYVQTVAIEWTKSLLKQDFSSELDFPLMQKISSWAVLEQDEIFMNLRDEWGHRYFQGCFKKKEARYCQEELNQFWSLSSLKDPEIGLKLVELQRQHHLTVSLWTFFSKVPYHPFSKFFCQKPLVQEALFQRLFQLFPSLLEEDKTSTLRQKVQLMISTDCWNSFLPAVKRYLYEGEGELQRRSFLILRLLDKWEMADQDFYFSLYLLEGPQVGPLFNEAWNHLYQLKQSYPRRQVVMDQFRQRVKKPGRLLLTFDQKRKQVISDHFYRCFPEYFEQYLNYCEGLSPSLRQAEGMVCGELKKIAINLLWSEVPLFWKMKQRESTQKNNGLLLEEKAIERWSRK